MCVCVFFFYVRYIKTDNEPLLQQYIIINIEMRAFSDAPHRTAVSMALLRLSESGQLMELKDKWWSVPEDQKCPVMYFIHILVVKKTDLKT